MSFFDSCSKKRLYAHEWIPSGTIQGVIFYVHGLHDHCARYDDFARHCNLHGFAVFALDHIGHGQSEGERGLWSDLSTVIVDQHSYVASVLGQYDSLPYFIVAKATGVIIATHVVDRIIVDNFSRNPAAFIGN